ncbi:MAG: pyruvate, phosphate dikinase [Deltaproteobacteria bacterium]|nr:pyruvate, phosphate dikinase [Deltaproteobacteria bacterium]
MPLLDIFKREKACRLLVNVSGRHVERYQNFRDLLTYNYEAMNIMAELEQIYYGMSVTDLAGVKQRYGRLAGATRNLIGALTRLAGHDYTQLLDTLADLDREINSIITPRHAYSSRALVVRLEDLTPEMLPLVGAKAGNLALAGNILNLPVPPGFAITALAFDHFMDQTGLRQPVADLLEGIDIEDIARLEDQSQTIIQMISAAEVPPDLAEAILQAYADLEATAGPWVSVAMRSSAVGEDTAASFAGQYQTELNVTRHNLLQAYKSVIAGKYSPRAISYRLRYGLDDADAPMGVMAIKMIEAQASGVVYTVDPAASEAGIMKVSAIWGLGEHLVSGAASPDVFWINKGTGRINEKIIARKETRLITRPEGGVQLVPVAPDKQDLPAISDEVLVTLQRYSLALEEYFHGPQDIEWAVDFGGNLFIMQSRPLGLIDTITPDPAGPKLFPNHPVILSGGQTAAPGTALGRVFRVRGDHLVSIPDEAILTTRTASPDYANFISKLKGIITDTGSVASHLASVAREFGIPALVNTGRATEILQDGEPITLVADTGTVYQGLVPELAAEVKTSKDHLFDSPLHIRLRAVLDKVSPLHLINPDDPSFTPENCRSVHDIIRFTHEKAMRAMFGVAEQAGSGVQSTKLQANIPLVIYFIDLGGGLKRDLTTCDTITPDEIESIPMRAIWAGFSHPGITWSGTVNFDVRDIMTLMASAATSEVGAGMPGGDSYAVVAGDYLNLSAKFGYHYANIDALCGEMASQNYIALQFAGGAGSYLGRSLRISFLAHVLERLGFRTKVTGDLLEASLTGLDLASMENALDQLGRLMASSRLLDVAVHHQDNVEKMTEAFFNRDYDFLDPAQNSQLPGYYTYTGQWEQVAEEGRGECRQDGSKWGYSLSSSLANLMVNMIGPRYQKFLDNIQAYFYFPMAIPKDSDLADGEVSGWVNPEKGSIDRAGGLAFGIKNVGNYFVFRINALEDNAILFEFINNRRFQRASLDQKVETGRWYYLKVKIDGPDITCYLDDEPVLAYAAAKPVRGYVGLWTKADSVTSFKELAITTAGEIHVFDF